jgi:hypothetical protein
MAEDPTPTLAPSATPAPSTTSAFSATSASSATSAPSATPAALPKPDKKNAQLFDLTILVFKVSTRATQTIIDDVTKDALPLAQKKLEMAERILPATHPQRQKHFDAVANIEKVVTLGTELLKAIETGRAGYFADMPEYSTGLFAAHNGACVARFLEIVNGACKEMKEAYPVVAAGAQFRTLEGLQSHVERCT